MIKDERSQPRLSADVMKIAYVSADLGVPIFGHKGCSIHAQEVLSAFLRRGDQVDLFSPSSEGERPAILKSLILHSLPRPPKGDPAAREQALIASNASLQSELQRAGAFNLVYERYSLWSYAAMEFGQSMGVPTVLEVNAPLIEEQAQYRVLIDRTGAGQVAERAFRAATALLAVSDEVAGWLERFPTARKKIHVVPNAIRPERFPEGTPAAFPAAAGVFTVGFVGTLKPWHGLSVLAEAFDQLHIDHPSTRLLIVGDGPERKNVTEDLVRHGLLESTSFTGIVPPTDVPALLASMDVAVAPYPPLSTFYFSPLKVYEYMAAGRAVVASRIGQLQNLIEHEVNGLLVSPGDAHKLAAALKRLLNEPELRTRLGRRARATVLRDYTWDGVVQRIVSLAGLDSVARPTASA
jgi:glycosyltransferase involved in cell wall biosynthesis